MYTSDYAKYYKTNQVHYLHFAFTWLKRVLLAELTRNIWPIP